MKYIPERGDIVWVDFDPQTGREINKRRPALVISPKDYNKKTGRFIIFPITSKIKSYPFEVLVNVKGKNGAVISDQPKSFDWVTRKAKFIQKTDKATIEESLKKLSVLLGRVDI